MVKGSRERFLFGVVCALAGGALWGFSGACSQYLFAHYDIDASFITAARMLGCSVLGAAACDAPRAPCCDATR